MATSKIMWFNWTIIRETMTFPNIEAGEAFSVLLTLESRWMSPILRYLQSGETPPDRGEAKNIRRKAANFTLLSDKLYQMGRDSPMLKCLDESDIILVLAEVHKGVCSSHIGGQVLAHKLLRAGYY